MVAFLFCGISLVYKFEDAFNVSYNASSTCVLEWSTDPSSYVIAIFVDNFPSSTTLIMDVVVERLLLVRGSEITSDTTYWC